MEKLLRLIWPPETPERVLNPDALFSKYLEAISALNPSSPEAAEQLLASAREMYDAEDARQISCQTRAATLVSGAGIVLTIASHSLNSSKITEGPAYLAALIFYTIGIVYFIATIALACRVLGPWTRHSLGPNELDAPAEDRGRHTAAVLLKHTVANYRLNNRDMDTLARAIRTFWRALFAIALGTVVPPWIGLVLNLTGCDTQQGTQCAIRLINQFYGAVRPMFEIRWPLDLLNVIAGGLAGLLLVYLVESLSRPRVRIKGFSNSRLRPNYDLCKIEFDVWAFWSRESAGACSLEIEWADHRVFAKWDETPNPQDESITPHVFRPELVPATYYLNVTPRRVYQLPILVRDESGRIEVFCGWWFDQNRPRHYGPILSIAPETEILLTLRGTRGVLATLKLTAAEMWERAGVELGGAA